MFGILKGHLLRSTITIIKVLLELIAFLLWTMFFTSTDILAFAQIEQACHKKGELSSVNPNLILFYMQTVNNLRRHQHLNLGFQRYYQLRKT